MPMFKPFKHRAYIVICAGLLICTQSAYAQESRYTLEEITVIAQKREQSLQDVGIAITAITNSDIRSYGFSNAIDIIKKVPSLDNYSPFGPGSNANITIRGIGLNDFGDGHEAPVTAYIDEFYLVSVPAVDFALFDLDRVEVLRGPQGTLFGRNSTGGLVHYITAKPTKETSGFISLGGGRFGEIRAEGAISGSLAENVAGRISFLAHHSGGYIENLNPDLADDEGGQAGTNAVRAQLEFEPSEDLRILVKAEYADISKIHTYYEQTPMSSDPVSGLFSSAPSSTDGAGYNEANFGAAAPNVTNTSAPSDLDQDGLSFLLRIEKEFGDISLTSLTGYLEMDRELIEDCDASKNTICAAEFPYQSDWVTQEVRLDGNHDNWRWTAGVYYLHQNAKAQPDAVFNVPVGGPTAVDPASGLYVGPVFPIALSADWEQDTDSYSIFGQIEYDVMDNVTLIGGIRWGHDKKDFTDADNASLRSCPGFPIPTNCFLPPTGTGIPNVFSAKYSEDLLSWKVAVDFRPTDDILLYASISEGTKSGGFNNGFYSPAASNTSLIPYGDESNLAYEIGIKSTWLEDRVRVNVSAFHYDYSDFQTFNWEGIGGLVINSEASATGAEIELEAVLTDSLSLTLGGSILDTEIEGVTGRSPTFTEDREMSNAPDNTANGSITYAVPLAGNFDVRLLWDWNYVSKRFTNNFNDPTSELEDFFKHNASVEIKWDDNWALTGYVRNISDNEHDIKVFVFADLGYRQVIHAQPRTYGATLSYSF